MGLMKLATKKPRSRPLTTVEIYLQLTTTNEELSADTSLFIYVISCDFKDYRAAHHLQMLLLV